MRTDELRTIWAEMAEVAISAPESARDGLLEERMPGLLQARFDVLPMNEMAKVRGSSLGREKVGLKKRGRSRSPCLRALGSIENARSNSGRSSRAPRRFSRESHM